MIAIPRSDLDEPMTSFPDSCVRCILPRSFPGLRFNEAGMCHFCQDSPSVDEIVGHRHKLRTEIETVIAERRDRSQYDCIVALSGGKDSSYSLMRLVTDYKLSCLAVTIDNGFLADEAVANSRTVTTALGVDHILFAPNRGFMHGMYRSSVLKPEVHSRTALTRASSICNSCITLINAQMVQFAQQYGAGLIAGGYIGGQVPKDMAVLLINPATRDKMRSGTVDRLNKQFGHASRRYFNYSMGEDANPGREVAVINPMLSYLIGEDDIMDAIRPLGWRRPQRTGITSTNCLLNDFGVHIHHKQFGFHPYALEIAEQVRSGLMTREEGFRKYSTIPRREDVDDLAAEIGLTSDEY